MANKNGKILEKLHYQGGKLLTKEINKYDLRGNLISNEKIDFCNSTDCEIDPYLAYEIVKYIDFDANGNCTKVIRTHQEKNGKQLSQRITIEETKIEYAK